MIVFLAAQVAGIALAQAPAGIEPGVELEKYGLSELVPISAAELDDFVSVLLARDESVEPFAVRFEVRDFVADGGPDREALSDVVTSGLWGRWGRSFFARYTVLDPTSNGYAQLASDGNLLLQCIDPTAASEILPGPMARLSDQSLDPRVLSPGGLGSAGLGWLGQRWSLMLPAFKRHHWVGTREISGRICRGLLADQGGVAAKASEAGELAFGAPFLVWFDLESLLPMRLDKYYRPEVNPMAAQAKHRLQLGAQHFGRLESHQIEACTQWKGAALLPTRVRFDVWTWRLGPDGQQDYGASRTGWITIAPAEDGWTRPELEALFSVDPPSGYTVLDERSGASWVATADGPLALSESEHQLAGLLAVLRKRLGQVPIADDFKAAAGAGGTEACAAQCLWLAARLSGKDLDAAAVQAAFGRPVADQAAALFELERAAQSLGLPARAVEADGKALGAPGTLAIVHLVDSDWTTGHFALLLPRGEDPEGKLLVASPPDVWTSVTPSDLESISSGPVLLIEPAEAPPPGSLPPDRRIRHALAAVSLLLLFSGGALWLRRRRLPQGAAA